MPKLTVAIITLNEEERIRKCLESVKEIADEILVVDSYSTDATKAICEEHGARFVENKFDGHIEQKNVALNLATHDFVLSLDADEALSEEAIGAIKKIKEEDQASGYVLNRITNYCGQWIRYCGWYPDKKLRLVDRRVAKWVGENPHDKLILTNGEKEKSLTADILHYSFPTIASHVKTANHFSEIAAHQGFLKKKKINILMHIILNPMFTFWKKYLFQLGFLDGFYGFVICTLSAYANFLKYSKLWQLYHEDSDIKD